SSFSSPSPCSCSSCCFCFCCCSCCFSCGTAAATSGPIGSLSFSTGSSFTRPSTATPVPRTNASPLHAPSSLLTLTPSPQLSSATTPAASSYFGETNGNSAVPRSAASSLHRTSTPTPSETPETSFPPPGSSLTLPPVKPRSSPIIS
ncbi:unnamed protein product, partial [Ectocarpus fasciculatus]